MADPTDVKQTDDSVELLISATANPPATTKKVELDLDDAPFLQTEKEIAPGALQEVNVPENPDDEAEKAGRRKRKIIIAAVAAGAVVIAAAAVWWFFFREPPAPPPALDPEIIVVPSAPAPAASDETVRAFAPFVVPVTDAAGSISFLICKFSAISKNPNVNQEIDRQRTALRDAIYFYLRSKPAVYLQDARNGAAIKDDLLSVFNDYLTQGKLEDILFESYLSR